MNPRDTDLDRAVPLTALLGYLNFSEGKPDARFQKQLQDTFAHVRLQGATEPWQELERSLSAKLDELRAAGSGAFQEAGQARAVLDLVFHRALPAYRRHHADLLFHLSDAELFTAFFLARVFEAVLSQGPPWEEGDRIVNGALHQLNDFVGHRPIAVLESRPRGEPYAHERVRPIPLFIRGAGVAEGRYRDLVGRALEILEATDPAILNEAYFQPDLLDELALDPRPYDQNHPAHRRPNYVFGEWDPHHLDNQGRFRRFVVRQVVLDGLLDRVDRPGDIDRSELLFEAAAVLAGTILMAAGTSGSGPGSHDSSTTLATLLPRIARYRDAFYAGLLSGVGGAHGERLRREAEATRQPFGQVRQHLNDYLSTHRARQLQHRHLALVYSAMGYVDAGRQEAGRIPAASIRMLAEIEGRLATGRLRLARGNLGAAVGVLPEAEELLLRGIDCGALVDPWNILGFQGLFPLFAAREDTIRDPRVDDLVGLVEQLLNLYSRLLSEAAARGDKPLVARLAPAMQRLARWWDRFATTAVQDVPRVHGGEAVQSAEHVARAVGHWYDQGQALSDLAFWKQHLEGFRTPKAFALVVEALLDKADYRAAMALLANWVALGEQVPLDDGEFSFESQALRWMIGAASPEFGGAGADRRQQMRLIKKFFDYLEANAGELWQAPVLEVERPSAEEGDREEADEGVFEAAYENVTYRDSADDDREGTVWDEGPPETEFLLQAQGEALGDRLDFLSTVARLWQVAARQGVELFADDPEWASSLQGWAEAARENRRRLLALTDALHAYPIPDPLGSHESMVEYDLRRDLKEQLLDMAIGSCLEASLAVAALQGVQPAPARLPPPKGGSGLPAWEGLAIRLEGALWRGDSRAVANLLPAFIGQFQAEPLLFTALADGGQPRRVFRARLAQKTLRTLVINLPRLGFVRQTYQLLRTARAMEQANQPRGRKTSEFNYLFQPGFTAVIEAVIDAAATCRPPAQPKLAARLVELAGPFIALWGEYSESLQLSSLEAIPEAEWGALEAFIRRYGGDLFHAKFMTLANLRGILHRGAGAHLDYLRDNPDPLHPVRLIDDLDGAVPRGHAERMIEHVLRALIENYDVYKDYNATTAQSDYGENLYMLLEFLRLKAAYERQAWYFRPLVLVHQVLARRGQTEELGPWQRTFRQMADQRADQFLREFARLEQVHGIRLRTVADRLAERFVKPLDLDRMCALIEPAMAEATRAEGSPAFEHIRREIEEQAAHPTGVGLDVPPWLRQVEEEVERVQEAHTAVGAMSEHLLRVPVRPLSWSEFLRQIQEWDKPL